MDQLRSEANSISTFDWQHPSIDIVSLACISMILGHGDGQRPLCFADASLVLDLFVPRFVLRYAVAVAVSVIGNWQITWTLLCRHWSVYHKSSKLSPGVLIFPEQSVCTLLSETSFLLNGVYYIIMYYIIYLVYVDWERKSIFPAWTEDRKDSLF